MTLFIGTVKGFTYLLTLRVAARDSAQILIRNAAAAPREDKPKAGLQPEWARWWRSCARWRGARFLRGYVIETFSGTPGAEGLKLLEVWRGPRFIARVFEADLGSGDDFDALMQTVSRRASPRSGSLRLRAVPRADGSRWRCAKPPGLGRRDEWTG